MPLRAMLLAGMALLIGWSAYWWIAASGMRNGIDDWLEARQADGWVAEYADLGISGYPSRVDARFDQLDLADPRTGWAWSAPAFQILALSYRTDQVILAFPGEQVLATPQGRLVLTGEPLRASVTVTNEQTVTRLVIEAEDFTAQSDADVLNAARLILATSAQDDPRIQRLGLSANDVTPPSALRTIAQGSDLADLLIKTANMDAMATFAAPPGLAQLGTAPPALERLEIRDISATWGALSIRAQGDVFADTNGYAEGVLSLRLRNWQQMLDMAVTSGAIREDIASALRFALNLMARMGDDPDALETTIMMANGTMSIGPLVIGEAPRMALR